MNRLRRCTIGVLMLPAMLLAMPAWAADDRDPFCIQDEYANDFECSAAGVSDPCADYAAALLPSFYMETYCDLSKDLSGEIYEAVANQMGLQNVAEVENDASVQEAMRAQDVAENEDALDDLFSVNARLIKSILELNFSADDLPVPLKTRNPVELAQSVQNAYQKERVITHMKQGLKNEFAASEIWYNGTDFDSGMDLIIDLNVIDRVLFGTQSQWENDVWKWPKKGEAPDVPPPPAAPAAPPAGTPAPADTPDGEEPAEPDFDPARDCVTDESEDGAGSPPGLDDLLNPGPAELPPGEPLMCADPEALNLQAFKPARGSDAGDAADPDSDDVPEEPETPACPPGSRPRTPADPLPDYPQNPRYPGPFIGGRLKEFPPSNQPDCPLGMSRAVTASHESGSAGAASGAESFSASSLGNEGSVCIPTKFCTDFNAARGFLLGDDWEEDESKSKIGRSIELLFCVEVKTHMRPESPYEVESFCTDCHIKAMVDTLDKMLENPIAPQENTTGSYAISSRWTPNLSFNLHTLVKTKLFSSKIGDAAKKQKKVEEARKKEQELQEKATVIPPADRNDEHKTLDTVIFEQLDASDQRSEEYFKDVAKYRWAEANEKERVFTSELSGLLDNWEAAFQSIQNAYTAIMKTSNIRDKKQCEF